MLSLHKCWEYTKGTRLCRIIGWKHGKDRGYVSAGDNRQLRCKKRKSAWKVNAKKVASTKSRREQCVSIPHSGCPGLRGIARCCCLKSWRLYISYTRHPSSTAGVQNNLQTCKIYFAFCFLFFVAFLCSQEGKIVQGGYDISTGD